MEDDVRQIPCFPCCLWSWGPEGDGADAERRREQYERVGVKGTACKLSCPSREREHLERRNDEGFPESLALSYLGVGKYGI